MEAMSLPQAALLSITPMIPTGGGLAEALKFYTEQMGFSLSWEAGGIAGIRRGAISFTLVENNDRQWADNASFSIGVSDVDALCEEYNGISARAAHWRGKPGAGANSR